MTTDNGLDIAIVGGGIAGLCLALSVTSNTSIPVTIYEAAPKFGEIGAGVAFGPNAVRAMMLISPELKAGFDARATTNQFPDKKDVWFDFHVGMDGVNGEAVERGVKEGVHLGSVKQPQPYSGMINRAMFLDVLVPLLPEGVARFGKILTDLDDQGDKGVLLTFADGTQARHAAVIGCDGIHSMARKVVLGPDNPVPPVYTGKYCYRGMVPMEKAVARLGKELATNCQAYLGYHGHMLTFPVAGARMMNVVAFYSSKEWNHATTVVPATKEQMDTDFHDWGPQVKGIIQEMGKSDIWGLFDHPPIDTYTKGRICIVGDAAHASTPFQGAGAGMAIEDAYVMGQILQATRRADQLPAAFRAFDLARRERTQKLVATSREAAYLWHFELRGDDLELIKEELKHRLDWLWDFDIEKDTQVVVQGLGKQ